ncbi:hypothetical protein DDE82_000821 [Stemphylium lycopersici]|uniref:Uncharacterized protein n=1 Tax=Stemphylium lycopersici TaxID=183478 RepID=A0A364MV75_STELY|nr:hypothetical protein DDE83_007879 [Stemphylium lycopersici]RAR11344.1 hypothetical protein DDE82_000821 [Stemphylium lycopersici]
MSSITLPTLPEPILHLICVYLTPDRPTVNDPEHGQSPTLYRSIINFSLTAHALNRISSAHIATNISLAWGGNRWDLFLRTVQQNPVYASSVKYLKLSESSEEEANSERPHQWQGGLEDLTEMFKALRGLETLFSSRDRQLFPGSILYRLASQEMPLWKTLQVVRFGHINAWGEERIVQLNLHREGGGKEHKYTSGNELLTGQLEGLNLTDLHKIPEVNGVTVSTRDFEDDGDEEEDADWVDEQEEDEDSDGWSERDYEYESEDSDWDSEDESDYEDDWEAEYGFNVPDAEPAKELSVPAPTVGLPAPGTSLLDF